MSLINEALKKAQRNRTGEAVGPVPPPPGGGGSRVTKRAQPRTSQQLVLIAAGAFVLVVLSVVATVYLVNRAPEPKPVSTAPKPAAPSATPAPAATPPLIVAPVLNPPVLTARPAPEIPASVVQLPDPKKSATAPSSRTAGPNNPWAAATPVATGETNLAPPSRAPAVASPSGAGPTPPTQPSPSLPAAGPSAVAVQPPPNPIAAPAPANPAAAAVAPVVAGPPKNDERISLFVDALRVAGIRPSGTESRVLMNDRVFRINEIVDRNFGLRLTKVEPNTLTFTDGNGAVYVKNF
jgi:hypothetical protein